MNFPFHPDAQADEAFERFAARVATLTTAECAALVAAHRPLWNAAARQWQADQRLILELGLNGFEHLIRPYEVAEAFAPPVAAVIVEAGLAIIDPPRDPAVAEAMLAGWNDVTGGTPQTVNRSG